MDRKLSEVPLEGVKILKNELMNFYDFPSGLLCFILIPSLRVMESVHFVIGKL
jgi:hypothetical protein